MVALADERLAHAYGQIARADEQLARVNEQLSKLEHDAPRHPWAVPGRRTSRVRPALRGLIGLLLAACIFVAAFVSQSSYGDAARLTIGRWVPQLIPTSSLPLEKSGPPAQLSSSAVQVAGAESVPTQPTPSAQAAPQDGAPAATTVSPELAQLLQTMANDLARVEQGVEQLKVNQAQMASDNAKAVEQLKASQEQMTRLIARASEQNLRPNTPAPPPRPIAPPLRKPAPTLQSPQARAHPQAPTQSQPKQQ
ncbi:hypothetical protein [Bradyrhizobium canariense]|uniref:hypothetical protein n=1 Tax=Bradyrhizobium canariense TaxID=255045 RepID=UPI001FCDBCC8|nr:hypothetical protein [Bradyrhizobium canariense]